MYLSWRARLESEPALRDFAQWPSVPLDTLPRRDQKRFTRNQQVIAQVLAGQPLQAVAREHALSPARVSQLLARCLGGEDSDSPALTEGLIPHRQVVTQRRRRPLPTQAQRNGYSCAFRHLLAEAPSLRAGLDAMIEAAFKDRPHSQRLTAQAVHGEFKRLLADIAWPRDRYPYTTASLGYQSVRRYLQQRTAALEQARLLRQRPTPALSVAHEARHRTLRTIQIDEHTVDLSNRVHLLLNDELIPLRLGRGCVLAAVDYDTTCVLGYQLVPTRHPSQQHLLALIEHCLGPWRRPALTTPELHYAPGACFPSGLDEAFPISFGTIQLDNALMHLAHSAADVLCDQFGATLSFGPPATPTVRQRVESIFNWINQRCTHRAAATTGSHPTDPIKESRKNRKKPPAITYQTLDEALSVNLTEYNVTPRASLGDASPLELFRHHCSHHFVRHVPALTRRQWQPLTASQEVALHWYRDERRRPHVNFACARYQGSGLLKVAGKEKRIRVHYDRRDIRTLHAYTLAGLDLGDLQVSTPWQRFPHSLATRNLIHRQTARRRLNARDPLAAYFQSLLEHKDQPSEALSLLRIYTEFTAGQGPGLVLEPDPAARSPKPSRYVWHPSVANHRA